MAAKGNFNIFWQGSVEPNPQQATNMFSFVTTDENGTQRPRAIQTVSKRQTFRKEIRLKKNQQKRKAMRGQLIKTLESNGLFILLESIASKENLEPKHISNLIMDLRRNITDLDFCKRLNEQTQIKKFILNIYLGNQEHLNLEQKCLLISCLIYLTFYNMKAFDLEQKQKLNDTMIKQISQINQYDWLEIEYLRNNIDLLTNIISDEDSDINHYLLDTSLFADIGKKITQITNEGQKITEMHPNDKEIHQKFQDGLDDIRNAFVSALLNLSFPEYENDSFFEFTLGQLVGDANYLTKNGVETLKILSNFFEIQKFRQRFVSTIELNIWFEKQVSVFCQKKFVNPESKKTGHFSSIKLSQQERDLFYSFLKCMLTYMYEENDDYLSQRFSFMISFCLNPYCLSEFLIQCSQNDPEDKKLYRNSRYVSEAIRMYDYLTENPNFDSQKLLLVTSQRNYEDIFKVLLDQTYFTSYRISQSTISVLNKMLGKNACLINTLNELGIFQSIDSFLSQRDNVQKPEQIENFFDLLTLMIDSDSQLENKKGDKKKINYIAARMDQEGFVQKIESYQDHENRKVSERAESFLQFILSFLECNEKYLANEN